MIKAKFQVSSVDIRLLRDVPSQASTAFLLIFSPFQPEYKVADPICTFLFSVFVLCTTITILRDVFRILMEGTPPADQI